MLRPRLPLDLLYRSAQESSRLLALSYLDQIDAAQGRLSDSVDQAALHDFRVGLRRLRSSLRAYRVYLKGSVTGKMRRQVRELARSTNAGRDTEVQLSWLREQVSRLGADDIPAAFWLTGRLEGRKQERHDPKIVRVARRYTKAALRFRRALGVLRIELENGRGQTVTRFGEVTGELVQEQVIRLRDDLARVRGAADVDEVHRARITVKRLRYLVEPVARRNRRAGALIRQFKEAQDLLGEHHDMHVLSAEIASLRAGLSANAFPTLESGLATLARLADSSATSAFERFQSAWGGELANRILTRADELGRSLKEPPVPAGTDTIVAREPSIPEPAPAQPSMVLETRTSQIETRRPEPTGR